RTDVDGLNASTPFSNPFKGQDYPSFKLTDPQYVHETPPHEHDLVVGQIDGGKMDGFVSEFAGQYQLEGPDARAVMGYYDADTLNVYDAMAKNSLVCDRWFASHPGPTFCNRFYMLTGRLNRDADGNIEFNNFSGASFRPVSTKTVFDHLSDRGVSWRFYENRYCTLRLYGKYTFDDANIVDFNDPQNGFAAAAAAGTLPSVSFIDPNFIDEPDAGDNDDAAPGNLSAGQALIGGIVNNLIHSPVWGKTLFLVTYDEHGGFFDHVSPLDPEFRTNAKPVSGIDFYGVRVPTFVVSPWVAGGTASKVIFDHTSIIKTIARRFMSANPPDMGERVAAANDLSAVIQAAPQQGPLIVPSPTPPARTTRRRAPPAPSQTSTEFEDVMRLLQARYPMPTKKPVKKPVKRPRPSPTETA
ncbi:MAG TPA: alkaline phosphatase family protein, partial [Phenylobacterium sp.]